MTDKEVEFSTDGMDFDIDEKPSEENVPAISTIMNHGDNSKDTGNKSLVA